jgi:hypothetical protein
MSKKQARPKYQTPRGVFVYPHLNKPDEREFKDGTKAKPAFKCRLKLEGADAEKLREFVDSKVKEAFQLAEAEIKATATDAKSKAKAKAKLAALASAHPYEEELDDEGNETGALLFNFKQNAEVRLKDGTVKHIKVPVFDAAGGKIDLSTVMIGGGSEGHIAFSMRPYYMHATDKAGITLDLLAVQVLELREFGDRGADAFGFGKHDGYTASDGEAMPQTESAEVVKGGVEDEDVDF